MRISLGAAFVMMVVTEMVAATDGIGYVTLAAEQQLQIPQMWAGMLLLGVLGYALNLLFVAAEHRVLGWHRGQRAHQGAGRVL
jgi:ABC-type nitrate/sulfonate/bicarbonate transport system permease component